MKKALLSFTVVLTAVLFLNSFSAHALSDSCCSKPDSLSIKGVTDSGFCVKWKIKDSTLCDTPRAGVIQWRIVGGSPVWNTAVVYYSSGQKFASYCDTGSACRTYQWRVKSACLQNNGDTTFSSFVNGPNFTLSCRPFRSIIQQSSQKGSSGTLYIKATPNPVHDIISISGEYNGTGKMIVTILNNQGIAVYLKEVEVQGGKFKVTVNASRFDKGLYFIHGSDGQITTRLVIMKE